MSAEAEAIVVLITAPPERAPELARSLVEARLAACVAELPIRSTYRWKDAIEVAAEVQLVLKTTRDRFAGIEAHLLAHHPYEVPELVALRVADVGAPYLAWLRAETA
ncbi:MAG: divalent-cation tolerance protein CutA [Sandaracinus sp.]